jgi:two-component system chemotaxis response regulator CheY
VSREQTRILVVDDEVLFRVVLTDTLEHAGFTVVEAEDGEEALRRAASDRPDLMILDLNMPRTDGRGVIRGLKNASAPPRIVVMTGTTDNGVPAEDLGALSGFLLKPFSSEDLLRVCEFALAGPALVPAGRLRSEVRRTFACPATLRTGAGPAQTGRLAQISRRGFRMETSATVPPGTRIEILFHVPGHVRLFHLRGCVRWRRESMLGGWIESLNREDEALLEALIDPSSRP